MLVDVKSHPTSFVTWVSFCPPMLPLPRMVLHSKKVYSLDFTVGLLHALHKSTHGTRQPSFSHQ